MAGTTADAIRSAIRPLSGLQRMRPLAARHSTMLLNAGAIIVGAGMSAILGFAFWWFAARNCPASAVGFAAAAISMMNFLALVGEMGMGTLLMGELPKLPQAGASLVSATLLSTIISMVAVGLLYLMIAGWAGLDMGSINGTNGARVLFLLGVVLTGLTLVLDQALVGLLCGSLQMLRTTSFAAIKLLLLAVAAYAGSTDETGIFVSWIAAQIGSTALLAAICALRRKRFWVMPRLRLLRPLVGTVLRHHLLSIVIQVPGLLLPVIVASALSSTVNAAFYAAWTIFSVILLVPANLAAVLYSVGAREPAQLAHRLKLSLAISIGVGVAGAALLVPFSNWILTIFHAGYASTAAASLQLLSLGTFPVIVKYHYVTIQRLRYRMTEASAILGAGAALQLILALEGARLAGLFGLTCGWLIAASAEAIVLSPVVVRALRNSASGERSAETASTTGLRAASRTAPRETAPELLCEPT